MIRLLNKHNKTRTHAINITKLITAQSIRIWIIIMVFLFVSCKNQNNESNIYTYQMPEQLNDGWTVSTLEDKDIWHKIISSK